jgi:CheY-like chemotaxis protein
VSTGDLQAPPEGATVVLVIDDDPAMRELTKHFLGKEGFHVEAAASGEDGLRLARKLRPDVITLDVVMPGMDGYSVVSALMADEELRDIPVVMLTIVDEKSHGFPQGVADYMKKPIDWERLTALLNKYRYTAELACTVLVIDDSEIDRELLKRMLERDGWVVETAENGRIGLERVAERQPDLILLDLNMPEMDGFEFVKALRREPRWATIPIAIITARDITFEDRIRLGGCVEKFLEKGSYSKEELLREVRDLVSACARPRPGA